MITALLITLIFGGADPIFIIDDIDKKIKKEITDETRRDEIMATFKVAKKEFKSYQKDLKKKVKEGTDLQEDRNTTQEQFNNLVDEVFEMREQHFDRFTDYSIEIRSKLTDQEFNNATAEATSPTDKQEKKTQKKEEKADEKVNKILGKLKESIQEEILDPDRLKQALAQYEILEADKQALIQEIQDLNYQQEAKLRVRTASRADFEQIFQVQQQVWDDYYQQYVDMHFKLVELTTEDEWKAISKKMNSLLD